MSEERHEKLTVEEIKQRLRTCYQFYPTQPGLLMEEEEMTRLRLALFGSAPK